MRKVTIGLLGVGILLHLDTVFFRAEGGFNEFLLEVLVWSLVPYFVLFALLRWKKRVRVLCATAVVLLVDIGTYLMVFVFPQSSTGPLALLWMPLWNLVLSIPIGIGVGALMEKTIDKKPKRKSG